MKTKVFQVRVSFKSVQPNVKIKPSSLTGVVQATCSKQACDYVVESYKDLVGSEIIVSATSKSIPCTFMLNANTESKKDGESN